MCAPSSRRDPMPRRLGGSTARQGKEASSSDHAPGRPHRRCARVGGVLQPCLPTASLTPHHRLWDTGRTTFCINSGDTLLMRERIQELVKIKDLEESAVEYVNLLESTLEKERLAAQE